MKDRGILGLSWPLYFVIFAVLIIAMALGVLPSGLIGAFLFLLIVGELLNFLGNNIPIVNTYLGGGAVVAIFGGAALVYFGLIPETGVTLINDFMKSDEGQMGFLDFYIAALITGSILGMNRKLLIKAAIRYLPAILGAVIFALALVALVAPVFGYSPAEAMAYVVYQLWEVVWEQVLCLYLKFFPMLWAYLQKPLCQNLYQQLPLVMPLQ